MINALGFSLGIKRASAFGVVGVSSSLLKNGTCKRTMKLRFKTTISLVITETLIIINKLQLLTLDPSFLYFLRGYLILLCERWRAVNTEDILTGAGLSWT
jgi:hypothetical protein